MTVSSVGDTTSIVVIVVGLLQLLLKAVALCAYGLGSNTKGRPSVPQNMFIPRCFSPRFADKRTLPLFFGTGLRACVGTSCSHCEPSEAAARSFSPS